MGRTTELRREIKQRFIPMVISKGFTADNRYAPNFLGFRKVTAEAVYVFDIQWEKYGSPRFVINFGKCSGKGVISHGEFVPPAEVTPAQTPFMGRLQPKRGGGLSCWFRQDRLLWEWALSGKRFYSASEVVTKLIELFPEVETYWSTGNIGPHIHALPPIPWLRDAV